MEESELGAVADLRQRSQPLLIDPESAERQRTDDHGGERANPGPVELATPPNNEPHEDEIEESVNWSEDGDADIGSARPLDDRRNKQCEIRHGLGDRYGAELSNHADCLSDFAANPR